MSGIKNKSAQDSEGVLVRIQKYIAECTNISRRQAERLIESGDVRLNGKVVTELGTKMDPSNDSIKVKNQLLHLPERGILILHKPLRFITSRGDPEGRATIYELLSKKYQEYITVGRLDYNTSGLLILTNDGDLANRLMHPRYEFVRKYETLVKGSIPEQVLDKITRGIRLADGKVVGKAKIIEQQGPNTLVSLELSEGRNRIVRRIMSHLGFPVIELKRISYGPFHLGTLAIGKFEKLDQRDYQRLRHQIFTENPSA